MKLAEDQGAGGGGPPSKQIGPDYLLDKAIDMPFYKCI